MPARLVGTEYFILRPLPALGANDAIVLIVRYRFNFLRFWLGAEGGVLAFDFLDVDLLAVFAHVSSFSRLGPSCARSGRRCSCRCGRARATLFHRGFGAFALALPTFL